MPNPIIIRRRGARSQGSVSTPLLSVSAFTDVSISLSWTNVSADNYILERSLLSDYSIITQIYSGSNLSFEDTGLTGSTLYYYRVRASRAGYIDSAYSEISQATDQADFDITSLGSTLNKIYLPDGTLPANYLDSVLPGFAQQWTDASGNGQSPVQTTAANKPQITADGMLADGSTLLRDSSIPALNTSNGEIVFYVVCKINTSSAANARLFDINGTSRVILQWSSSPNNFRFFTSVNNTGYIFSAPMDGYLILGIFKTALGSIIRANDGVILTEIVTGAVDANDLSIFATNAAANSMIGHIREVYIGQGLSTEQKENVFWQLMKYYRNTTRPVTITKGVEIRYNDTDWTYDPAYPGKNVISVVKVVADTTDGSTPAANTGLAYDLENNLLIVSGTPGSFVKVTKWNRDGTINTVTTTQITQGVAYNSETGDYYELLTTGINVKDGANNITKTLTFPGTEALPGMLFFHQHTKRFYTSYDGGAAIKVWTPDFVANTLTLHSTIPVSSEEGAAVNYIDNTIGFNQVQFKTRADHSGNLLSIFTFGGNTGANNEGLIIDPSDGTEWFNSDEFFHGGIVDGNRMWHTDSRKLYDKKILIPDQIRYEWGFLSGGLSIVGKYGESYLTGSGTWDSPVIDAGSYNLHQVLSNYKLRSGYSLLIRGSATAPTTTATTIFPRPFYNNSDGNAWGATVPSSYSADPTGLPRYFQLRITL